MLRGGAQKPHQGVNGITVQPACLAMISRQAFIIHLSILQVSLSLHTAGRGSFFMLGSLLPFQTSQGRADRQ